MNFIEFFKETFYTLRANKMRTFLTMLGIVIGISSVITMWSIGSGGKRSIIGDFQKLGYGKFNVTVSRNSPDFKQKYLFTTHSVEELQKAIDAKHASINEIEYVRYNISGEKKQDAVIYGSTEQTFVMSNITIIDGREFLRFDYENYNDVICIDNLSAKRLFGSTKEALGKYINIYVKSKDLPVQFKVVGVFNHPAQKIMSLFGDMPFMMAAIPYKSFKTNLRNNNDQFAEIVIEAKDPNKLDKAMNDTKNYLENKFNVKGIFKVSPASQEIDSFDKMLTTLSLFITLAASISLFVGGIGVMNIMLVTVVERTREIGIKKAIGATDRDILIQFLFESIFLTGLGGITGILLGVIFSSLIGNAAGIPPHFSLISVIISLSVSTLIGIIFGVSPARKAAKLNPIDALRSE